MTCDPRKIAAYPRVARRHADCDRVFLPLACKKFRIDRRRPDARRMTGPSPHRLAMRCRVPCVAGAAGAVADRRSDGRTRLHRLGAVCSLPAGSPEGVRSSPGKKCNEPGWQPLFFVS